MRSIRSARALHWDGKRYVHAGGSLKDIASFTLHPFENGASIVQSVSARIRSTSNTR